MKKIKIHPGLGLLVLALICCLASVIAYQRSVLNQGFGPSYKIVESDLFYLDKLMYEADLDTFEVLSGGYAKDAQYIYYDGRIVVGADVDTFKVLGYGIGYDTASGVWVFNRSMGLNGNDVSALGNMYFQVDGDVYYFEYLVKEADLATFETLEKDYTAKDKNNVYFRGGIVEETP